MQSNTAMESGADLWIRIDPVGGINLPPQRVTQSEARLKRMLKRPARRHCPRLLGIVPCPLVPSTSLGDSIISS